MLSGWYCSPPGSVASSLCIYGRYSIAITQPKQLGMSGLIGASCLVVLVWLIADALVKLLCWLGWKVMDWRNARVN